MAVRKTTTTKTAAVRNPARKMLVGGRKQTRRRTTRRRNPATPVKAVRRSYRRNPSPTQNALMFALGGALVISSFDYAINTWMPKISNPVRIGAKAVLGWGIGKWGKKILGNWAQVGETALYLAAAIDAVKIYLLPTVSGYLGSGNAVASQGITDQATGELGTRYFLDTGNYVDYFPSRQSRAYA